ncbi:hypothetical protein, partial [Staphylococcus aureus]|uniref:hypothetical protein n=1 Tax=Staphylococcus aureus TaxID=1280 RepID=UPI00356A8616|nr:hypothetical protein [Staphylococcus aureus]
FNYHYTAKLIKSSYNLKCLLLKLTYRYLDNQPLIKKQGVEKVYVHAFLDGRDVDQKSALKYIEETEA